VRKVFASHSHHFVTALQLEFVNGVKSDLIGKQTGAMRQIKVPLNDPVVNIRFSALQSSYNGNHCYLSAFVLTLKSGCELSYNVENLKRETWIANHIHIQIWESVELEHD